MRKKIIVYYNKMKYNRSGRYKIPNCANGYFKPETISMDCSILAV